MTLVRNGMILACVAIASGGRAWGGELGVGGSLGVPALLGVKAIWMPGQADQLFGLQTEVGINSVSSASQLFSLRLEGRYAFGRDGFRTVPFLGLGLKSGDVLRTGSSSDTPISVSGGLAAEFCALPGGGVTGEVGLQWKFSGADTTPVFGVIFNLALMAWFET